MWTRLRATVSRFSFVWSRRHLDDEAWREMNDHIDLLTARYIRQTRPTAPRDVSSAM